MSQVVAVKTFPRGEGFVFLRQSSKLYTFFSLIPPRNWGYNRGEVIRMRIFCWILAILMLSGCGAAPVEQVPATLEVTVTEPPQPTTVPTEAAPDFVTLLMNGMSVEEKVGQLFLARCPEEGAVEALANYHLGGFVLFSRDFTGETPDSLRKTLTAYSAVSSIAPLIAVDEEGGTVNRVSAVPAFRSAPFPSPRSLYASGGMDAVLAAEEEKAALLTSLGIHVNLAPVCDITTDPGAFLYRRSLGQSPEVTGQFAAETCRIYARYGLGSVLKHFPGYGNCDDTHIGTAQDTRNLAQLETDLLPFRMAMDAGCDAVMVSHITVPALDDAAPASLSGTVHEFLRKDMGFAGVILTDDLAMDAISREYDIGEAAVLAVLAGNDLICCTDYAAQYDAVLEAVQSGRIPMEALDTAVHRVLTWKDRLGLLG